METLFELIIRGVIINFLGVNIRYYFFKFFKKDIKKDDFFNNQEDIDHSFSQGFYNFFVGIISFFILSFGIAYILYVFGLL